MSTCEDLLLALLKDSRAEPAQRTEQGLRFNAPDPRWPIDGELVLPCTLYLQLNEWMLEFDLSEPAEVTAAAAVLGAQSSGDIQVTHRRRLGGLLGTTNLSCAGVPIARTWHARRGTPGSA